MSAKADAPVAYRIDINSMSGVAFATTQAKARWIAVSSYWEAGYGRKGLWPSVSAARALDLDCKLQCAHVTNLKICYSEDYLR